MRINKIIEAIGKEDNIAIVTHINPDGDALGSSLGLKLALESVGKTVKVYCQDTVPKGLRFIEGANEVMVPKDNPKNYSLAIALDCSDLERTGNCRPILERAGISINIDHHKSNTHYGDINFIDDKAAATAELVFELIDQMQTPLNKEVATALYTAIVSDSGGFSFSSTSPKTHRITARLIESGVDVDRVHEQLFRNLSIGWVKLLGNAINTLELYHKGKVATMAITREMLRLSDASPDQSNGIIRYAKDIEGVTLAILFRQEDDHTTKISLRSGAEIDVSELAEKFGGGGHARAAGCSLGLPIDKAEMTFMEAVNNLFKEL